MTNTKTLTKKLLATLLVVALIASVGMVFIGTTASSNSMSATSALTTNMADTRAIEADLTLDKFINGDKHIAGQAPKYGEADWNGRIEVTLNLSGVSFIYINVDPRDVALNDDIIVEYRSYYTSGTSEISQKIKNFSVSAVFYTSKGAVITRNFSKANDSQAGFTYGSGKGSVNGLVVTVTVETTYGFTRVATFYFGTKYADCK